MAKSTKKGRIFIAVFIIIAVIIAANFFQKNIKSFFYSFSQPIQKNLWAAGKSSSDFFASIFNAGNLKKENDNLNFKNQELLANISRLEELQKENENLKCALGVNLQNDFKVNMAQIVGKDISQDFILLDKGAKDGISKAMPVITAQKVLVGKISDVYDNFSKVLLISSKESSFDAQIREREVSGIIRGKGNLKIFFDLIPQDKEISAGDIVVSSSLAGFFPSDLLVGRITSVKRNNVEAFQQAELNTEFDINQLANLFIITGRQ